MIVDSQGAIVRGDIYEKKIALVFTGDEFADGGEYISKSLRNEKIKASFFLTGRFYDRYGILIKKLKKEGHYLGAHSDQHLLYCDWLKRDSLLISNEQFDTDLEANYSKMARFGIKKSEAAYFLPPFEWYNRQIADWTRSQHLTLVNFSPGTRSAADYTWPEMGKAYRSSAEIFESILNLEQKESLNGFILILHAGTDPRRKDRFYFHLSELVRQLKSKGYSFVRIDKLLESRAEL